MTEVFLVLLEHQVPKEIMALLVPLVLSVPSVHLVYQALLVPKEPRDLLDKLDQREKVAYLDPRVHRALLAMSSILCPSWPQ